MKPAFTCGTIAAIALIRAAVAQPIVPDVRPVAFADLALDRAQTESLKHAPDVRAANAVVAEDAAGLSLARSVLGPSLFSNYALTPQANPNFGTAPQIAAVPMSISQRLTSVGVQATVGDTLAYAPNVASAEATLRSAQASLAAAQRAERSKVIGLYYEALKALAVARARNDAVSVAKTQRDAAGIRVRAGDAPRLDLVRANVTLARAVAAAALAGAALENAAQALRIETGLAVALDRTIDGALPQARLLTPEEAVLIATRDNPELQAAQATTQSARAAAVAAGRAALPAINLAAGYARGQDSGLEVSGPIVNVGLVFPLGGGAFAGAAQKRALAAQAEAKQENVARQLLLDVSAAARNLSAAHRATAASVEARAEAQSEFNAIALGYKNGASSSLELAAAEDTLNVAVVDELTAVYDELKARDLLNVELGT
jgi:outer membrane protein TolC